MRCHAAALTGMTDQRLPRRTRGISASAGSSFISARVMVRVSFTSSTYQRSALRWTLDYLSQREMCGHTLADFQNTRFELADRHASTLMQRVFVDRCVELHLREELDATDAAAAKLVATNLQCQVLDRCLQRFGGWGDLWEYPITRAFAEARMSRIGGGATEIMKQIIANSLLPKMPRGGKSK